MNTDLLDAQRANDVTAFLRAQRQGSTAITRLDADTNTGAGQRATEFAAQRAEAARQREQQLADLQTNYIAEATTRRAAAAEQLEDLRAQMVAQLDAQREAGRTRRTEEQRLNDELTALKARWAREDEARRRNEQRQAFLNQLNDLRTQQSTLNGTIRAAYNQQSSIVGNFASVAAQRLLGVFNQATALMGRRNTTNPISDLFNGTRVANASGGIYSRPTDARLGEMPGVTDVVFPVRSSEGIGAALYRLMGGGGMGRSVQVQLTGDIYVGENVTPSQLTALEGRIQRAVMAGIGG